MVELPEYEDIDTEEEQPEQFEDVEQDTVAVALEEEFRNAALQIVVQRNDFLLPNLIDMLKTHKTLEITPYYQRRTRWSNVQKSRLIESFLINIPIPPVFLYENDFARYEVMDGQQRVSSILEYFDNQYSLRGLELLTSLNGKRFHDLPMAIKGGLQRRSLSAIILLKESAPSRESIAELRKYVFQRLNTGGMRLNAQEVRNAVFAGPFNDLLVELSRHHLFTKMWDIPPYEADEKTNPSERLRRNTLYRLMRDVEHVLRVFALMDPENITGGMKRTLDNTMEKYAKSNNEMLERFRHQYTKALELAFAIGGNDIIRIPSTEGGRGRPSASLYDGIMVALARKLEQADKIEACADLVKARLVAEWKKTEFHELVTGRANTKESTLNRSRHIEKLIDDAIKV